MTNKLYEKIKQFISQNLYFILSILVVVELCTIPLPCYIHAPGGLVDIKKRVEVKNGYESTGSINMAYVSEYQGTIPLAIRSFFDRDWELIKEEEIVGEDETKDESEFRNELLLAEANDIAIMNAFRYAKVDYKVLKEKFYVTYVDPDSNAKLKIGDEILAIDDVIFSSKAELSHYIQKKQANKNLKIKILRGKKVMEIKAKTYRVEDSVKIGIVVTSRRILKTTPEVKFHFSKNESGPSGGMMVSLAIYSNLVKKDITKGKTIAGTGTIDESGNIGEIGGVIYKVMGAEREHADIFFVPSGENYRDAIQIKQKRNYKVKIVEVKTFDDVIRYLENM